MTTPNSLFGNITTSTSSTTAQAVPTTSTPVNPQVDNTMKTPTTPVVPVTPVAGTVAGAAAPAAPAYNAFGDLSTNGQQSTHANGGKSYGKAKVADEDKFFGNLMTAYLMAGRTQVGTFKWYRNNDTHVKLINALEKFPAGEERNKRFTAFVSKKLVLRFDAFRVKTPNSSFIDFTLPTKDGAPGISVGYVELEHKQGAYTQLIAALANPDAATAAQALAELQASFTCTFNDGVKKTLDLDEAGVDGLFSLDDDEPVVSNEVDADDLMAG